MIEDSLEESPLVAQAEASLFNTVRDSKSFRVAVLTISRLLTSGLQVIIMAVLARLLLPAEYAIYFQSLLVFSSLAPILALGLPDVTFVVLAEGARNLQTRAILVANQAILLSITIAFALFLILGGNRLIASSFDNAALSPALNYIGLYLISMVPLMSMEGVLLVRKQTLKLVLFRVISRLLTLVGILLPLVVEQTALAALMGLSISSLFMYIIGFYIMWTATDPGPWVPHWGLIKQQLLLALPLLIGIGFGTLQSNFDKLIIAFLDTPENYILFAIGTTQIPLISLFVSSVTEVILADATRLLAEKKFTETGLLLWRAARSNAIVLLPISIYFWFLAPEYIRLIYTDQYEASTTVFRLFLLTMPARFINFSSIEIASGKTYLVPRIFVANTLLTAGLTILLFPQFGYYSAILAFLAVTYLFAIPAHFFAFSKVIGIPIRATLPAKEIAKTVTAIALASLPLLLKPWLPANDILRLAICFIVYAASIAVAVAALKIDIPLMGLVLARLKNK